MIDFKKIGFVPTIFVDDGHGINTPGKRTPVLPNGQVIKENEFNRPTAEKFIKKAEAVGFNVVPVAPELEDIPLKTRTDRANKIFKELIQKYPNAPKDKLAIFISFHYNAYDGKFGTNKGGFEVHYFRKDERYSKNGKILATYILKYLAQGTPQLNRGVKGSNFHVLRETLMTAALIEAGFMDVLEEAKLMLNENFQNEVATEVLKGICEYLDVPYEEYSLPGTPIIGSATATVEQAQQWAKKNNAPQEFINLAQLYWEIAPKRAGIDPAVAYVQFACETGFLYRDGKSMAGIDATYHNPCGLKTSQGGRDTDRNAHKRFKDWYEGITAHVDHLALYAGAEGYPRTDTPDPRHFSFIKGRAKKVEMLGGKWAPSPTYGKKLVSMLKKLQATEVEEKSINQIAVENAIKDGLITDYQYWIDVLESRIQPAPEYIRIVFQRAHSKMKGGAK